MHWYEETFRATVVLLAASLTLIGPGIAGLGGSLGLAVAQVALAAVLFVGRDRLGTGPSALGHDLGYYGEVLWLGPLVGAAVTVLGLTATPAELQALGGLVGLAGMANYFLRPVYRLASGTLGRIAGTGS